MKMDLAEIVFILDRSGSMSGLEKDTIGGYNSFLETQRKAPGEAHVTTVLFDDRYNLDEHIISYSLFFSQLEWHFGGICLHNQSN